MAITSIPVNMALVNVHLTLYIHVNVSRMQNFQQMKYSPENVSLDTTCTKWQNGKTFPWQAIYCSEWVHDSV